MTNPSAGWFPDPEDGTRQRYWDGTDWTEHRGPVGPTPTGRAYSGPPPNAAGATTSLVLGILSLVLCGLLTGIPAMVIGRRATKEVDESGGSLGGRGLGTAGFVTGLIGTILSTIPLLIVILVFAFGNTTQSSFEGTCSEITSSGLEEC